MTFFPQFFNETIIWYAYVIDFQGKLYMKLSKDQCLPLGCLKPSCLLKWNMN